jgi:serine/threonine protein kinase
MCAIEALHEKNIIFRDLKPDNICLDADGHAMLTDNVLSRMNIKNDTKGAESFCGSYAYLAPEMLKKKGHGKAVDWYLIGVVLYELLTGMPPYYDDDK